MLNVKMVTSKLKFFEKGSKCKSISLIFDNTYFEQNEDEKIHYTK